MATTRQSLDDFLRPLDVDIPKIHSLARSLSDTFTRLAKESLDQFLSTPISDSVLRPSGDARGRFLAIDIGGTNLRVGFIELLGHTESFLGHQMLNGENVEDSGSNERSRVLRHLEKSWPIGEQLKNNKAEDLFTWIGKCIAEVVQDGCLAWPGKIPDEIPLGVTFSFPMNQSALSEAKLLPMGKGFAMEDDLDLGKELLKGYENSRDPHLPRIKITAIANDAVSTLVSFAYQFRSNPRRKAAMGLIVGTGCNATIPMALSLLHPSKRPRQVKVLDDIGLDPDLKIAVNTEWTIKGAAGPLYNLGFMTHWDQKLDKEGDRPGFQPFEYMTAGRYLGELGRIIIVDYFANQLHIPEPNLPARLRQRHGLTTTFLGNLGPHLATTEPSMLKQIEAELPSSEGTDAWQWTAEAVSIVFEIAKAVQIRAAGMTAAAIVGLLACAGEIDFSPSNSQSANQGLPNGNASYPKPAIGELLIGYTGGCIVHFQDYLQDCQSFLDSIMSAEFGVRERPRVLLTPCHDGGIMGAGILAGTVQSIAHDV